MGTSNVKCVEDMQTSRTSSDGMVSGTGNGKFTGDQGNEPTV